MVFLLFPVVAIWLFSIVAELNRTPFDFAEGERELVSGFNVEYGGMEFAMIFMAEYGIIIFFGVVTFYVLVRQPLLGVVLVFLVLLFRGGYPRYRYDKLMGAM